MSRHTITAILPNYNYAHFILSRIEEVLTQTYPISELIILDDASTDNSTQIIEAELTKIRHTHHNLVVKTSFNKKNSGNVFSQWQKGIKLATSDYVWIAELDDACSPKLLETLMRLIKANSNVVLAYAASRLVGSVRLTDHLRQLKDFSRRRHLPGSYCVDGLTELNRNLAVFNSIPNVSACIFKRLPELPNLLDSAKQFHLAGDWFFYSELARHGQIAYTPRRLNYHRLSANSVTGKTTYADRFRELQAIHRYIIEHNQLSPSTLRRIQSSEAALKKSWHLS